MRFGLISAWNDSGGGFVHRLLDGHSQLSVWPFELQLGNGGLADRFSALLAPKYRWPVEKGAVDAFFDSIADAELKSVLSDSQAAKHRSFPIHVAMADWHRDFLTEAGSQDRKALITAYIDSFWMLWRGCPPTNRMVAHCPSIIVDAPLIFADFPDTKLVHVVRDPVAGIGDFRRRHPGFAVDAYAMRWSSVNGAAAQAARQFPGAVLIVDFAELLEQREVVMRRIARHLEIPYEETLLRPSWNGRSLDENAMGPFGGVPRIGHAHEAESRAALSILERDALLRATQPVRQVLNLP